MHMPRIIHIDSILDEERLEVRNQAALKLSDRLAITTIAVLRCRLTCLELHVRTVLLETVAIIKKDVITVDMSRRTYVGTQRRVRTDLHVAVDLASLVVSELLVASVVRGGHVLVCLGL